jgi:gas vesicle protein
MNSKDNFVHFAMGIGIGAALGMLLAPRSGSDTRGLIRSKAQEGSDYVRSKAQEGSDYLKHAAGETAGVAKQTVERVKKNFKSDLQEAVDMGKQAYREATEGTLG